MKNASDEGFFTLEAIVALAITSFVLVAYFQAMSYALQGTARARLREELLATGLSQLDAAPSREAPVGREGTVTNGAKWSVHVEPITSVDKRGEEHPLQAFWVVFEASDVRGHSILELRTIKLLDRQK